LHSRRLGHEILVFQDYHGLHDQWLQLHPKWNAQSYIMKREVEHPDPEGEKEYFHEILVFQDYHG
jgi:hypothetical protein